MKTKPRIITLAGVTAPIAAWEALGLAFYDETDNQRQCSHFVGDPRGYFSGQTRLGYYIARAKDELPDASGERLLNRVATLVSKDKLADAMQTLGEGLKKGLSGHLTASISHDLRPALRQLLPDNAE